MHVSRSRACPLGAIALITLLCSCGVSSSQDDPQDSDRIVRTFGESARRSFFGARCDTGCFAVAFAPDGREVTTGHAREARRWEVESGKLLETYPNPRGTVHAAAYSRDGHWLAWGGYARSVALVDRTTGKQHAAPEVGICVGFFLDFSADGKRMVSAGSGGRGNAWSSILLWDVDTMKQIGEFRVPGTCWRALLTPDAKTLVTADSKGDVLFWDVDRSDARARLPMEGGAVLDLELSADGTRVVAVSSAPVPYVSIAATASGEELRRIPHEKVVRAVALSPDGKVIATAGNSRGIRLFDADTGAPRGTLAGHRDGVSSLAFSPDGRRLLSGGFDGSAILWDVDAR